MASRQTIENLRLALDELRELREELRAKYGLPPLPLPRPRLRVIEGGETWVRDPEEEDD